MSNQKKRAEIKSRTGLDYDFKSTKFFERKRAKYGDKHAKAHVDHMRGLITQRQENKGRGNVLLKRIWWSRR